MKKWFGLLSLFGLYSCGMPDNSASSLQEGPEKASFSILSYNVQSRPLLDTMRARKNLPQIGEKLNAFDLAGVQECFSLCDHLLNATQHASEYYFKEREHWWSLTNSGLASVSRFPLVEVKKQFFKSQAEIADQVASKGVLLMRYRIAGKLVDVYNTHMQAGNSVGAQVARQRQAEEVIRFVEGNSPADHTVIVHGDFNMGPARPGKAWVRYEPQHYSSEADMLARTSVFSGIMQRLKLEDASDTMLGPVRDHIDRVLFRSGSNTVFKPIFWEDMGSEFVDAEGHALSDSAPIAVRFELE